MTFFEMILKNGKEREREGNQTAGEKMGAKGRDWMIKEYSWPHIANKMSLIYDWVTDNNEETNGLILKN